MADLIQRVRYPGVVGVREFSYTNSHGATPGIVIIVTNPQRLPPAPIGTCAFDDGVRGVALPNCRLVDCESFDTTEGRVYKFALEDQRWMWRNATVRASFNRLQADGKLVPWTIASPTEIAVYLLRAAGVTNYRLVLPAGLPRRIGRRAADYLRPGQNFPPTRTNPPCQWDGVPAMQALTEFAGRFGCRVIYQPAAGGRVLVAPLGGPWTAPLGGLRSKSVGVSQDAVPRAVGLLGAETLHQMRIPLEPVIEDYTGLVEHINDSEIAPLVLTQELVVDGVSTHPTLSNHRAEFKLPDPKSPDDEAKAQWFIVQGTTLADLQSLVAADARLRDHLASAALVSPTTLRLRGKIGRTFAVEFRLSGPGLPVGARFAGKVTSLPGDRRPSWGYTAPPTFWGARAVPGRLSRDEAMQIARKCVWRYYRIANCAPHLLARLQEARKERDPKKWPKLDPLTGPGFGVIRRRQQVVMTKDMVERQEPTARQLGGFQVGTLFAAQGQTILPDFYDGRGTARPAVVRGQYGNLVTGVKWALFNDEKSQEKKQPNTRPNTRVYVPFSIDNDRQLIIFSDYVYRWEPAGNSLLYDDPNLVYEGGCYLLDPVTDVPARYQQQLPIPGGTANPAYTVFDDVVVSWIGKYDANNRLTKSVRTDFGDGFRRANDYNRDLLRQYQVGVKGNFVYAGTRKIDTDGAVQQVTWKFSTETGPVTIVSLNCETSTIVPPWGPRQLKENLPPNKVNAFLDAAENPSGLGAAVKDAVRRNLPFRLGQLF